VRIDRLEEALAIVKGLFADKPFSFTGKHYTITDLDGQPKPVQKPGPPIVIGGGGKRVLSYAAREADIVGINANLKGGRADDPASAVSLNPASTDDKLQWVREAAGDRYDDIEIQSLVGFQMFTDDARGLAEAMAPAFETTPDEVLESPIALVGTIDDMVEQLE